MRANAHSRVSPKHGHESRGRDRFVSGDEHGIATLRFSHDQPIVHLGDEGKVREPEYVHRLKGSDGIVLLYGSQHPF